MNLSLFTQYQVPQTPKAMTLHKLKPQFASELNREWHSRLLGFRFWFVGDWHTLSMKKGQNYEASTQKI